MSDKVVFLQGVAAPTEQNIANALNTIEWLHTEVREGRITSILLATLSPADDVECHIVNVGYTNKIKFYGLVEVLRRFIQDQ